MSRLGAFSETAKVSSCHIGLGGCRAVTFSVRQEQDVGRREPRARIRSSSQKYKNGFRLRKIDTIFVAYYFFAEIRMMLVILMGRAAVEWGLLRV